MELLYSYLHHPRTGKAQLHPMLFRPLLPGTGLFLPPSCTLLQMPDLSVFAGARTRTSKSQCREGQEGWGCKFVVGPKIAPGSHKLHYPTQPPQTQQPPRIALASLLMWTPLYPQSPFVQDGDVCNVGHGSCMRLERFDE